MRIYPKGMIRAFIGLSIFMILFCEIRKNQFKQEVKEHDNNKKIVIKTISQTLGIPINRVSSISTDSGRGKILLLTYCRSGSTFTSEILQQNPDVYFWFEPFRNTLYDEFLKTNPARTITTKEGALRLLEDLFNCNLFAIPENFWRDEYQQFSLKGKFYKKCVTNSEISNTSLVIRNCLLELQNICKNSKYILIKTARIHVETVVPLIEKYKDLKLIHLTRDPRGLIFSRLRLKFYVEKNTVSEFAKNHCKILLKNIKDSKALIKKYPKRLMQLRYETLACDPINISRKLYHFNGFEFSKEIEETVLSMTGKGKFVGGPMGLIRPNSCQAAYAWKTTISNETAKQIENECVSLFQEMRLHNM